MKVSASVERGWIRGNLDPGEDRDALVSLLHHVKYRVLDGDLQLLVHEHLQTSPAPQLVEQATSEKLALLYQDNLKRWVVQIETSAGPRIVKVAEANSFRTTCAGILAQSVAHREHRYQLRTQSLELAAAESKGYLELWHGPNLVRCCQVQTLMDSERLILNEHVAREFGEHRLQAMETLGKALAHTHQKRFFHGDLKGFHAVVIPEPESQQYTLRWLDLARVGFNLSRRQRIINLYQMLRFVVPNPGDAREAFMRAYCEATGWYADNPKRAMTIVGRFLEHKLKTHPNP